MKIQIAFDILDLEKAIAIAHKVALHADILEVGSLLIYRHGIKAVSSFKKAFKEKLILADAKIVDRGAQAVELLAQSGAHWITVMSGTSSNVIHTACTTAHQLGKKIMLDLLDTKSLGQSAMDAKSIGVDALLFHTSYDEDDALKLIENWNIVRENTSLPIFISTKINLTSIDKIISLKPDGLILSSVITEADNPEEVAATYRKMLR